MNTSSSSTALRATSSFYGEHPAMRLVRLTLGATERLWPALAVRVAARLFGTPLPLRKPGRQAVPPGHWRTERWPFEDAEITLYLPQAQPHGPTVLLLHGWGGHARQMLPLADALAARGLRPVLVDLPAHGGSRGRVSNLPQFARAIEYATARLHAQDSAPHAVVAHSLAANAAAHAASRGLATGRLVLLAPPASPHEYTRLFAQVFGLSERTRAAMQRRIEAREGILMRQFEPPAAGHRGAGAPQDPAAGGGAAGRGRLCGGVSAGRRWQTGRATRRNQPVTGSLYHPHSTAFLEAPCR